MENRDDIILFAQEMLRQGPSRTMLKVYVLGSTLAMLGMLGGLVDMLPLPCWDSRITEEDRADSSLGRRKQELKLQSTLLDIEAEGMLGVVVSEAKARGPQGPPRGEAQPSASTLAKKSLLVWRWSLFTQ